MDGPSVLRQIAWSAISPELEKIEAVVRQRIPDIVHTVCSDLSNFLKQKAGETEDFTDLRELRGNLQTISWFLTLVTDASPDRSSWWAEPLIKECYRLCGIPESRMVLIIHAHDTGVHEFSVYPNILAHLSRFTLQDVKEDVKENKPLDIFVIPTEARFDLAFVALIGHEVGHVYWQIKRAVLIDKVKEEVKKLPEPNDIFEMDKINQKAERVAAHIEEYLCDQAGRYLLGPAFDYALLRLFCSIPNANSASDTHPPQTNRIKASRQMLQNYVKTGHVCYPYLKTLLEGLGTLVESLMPTKVVDDAYDQIAIKTAEDIYKESSLIIEERFTEDKLEKCWRMVVPELDSFRPPFETVTAEIPKAICPTEALVVAPIYFHGGAFKASNQYFVGNSQPEDEKTEILRKKLIEHLHYAISLYDFTAAAHKKLTDFDPSNWKDTLWDWRVRKVGGHPASFVVTPTISPKSQYGQNSVDLRLGCSFLVSIPSRYTHIDPAPGKDALPLKNYYQEIHVPISSEFVLHPHQFVLAGVLEYVCLPHDYYGLVLGRSTWGRLGLNIATATTVQAGYRGCLTLELRNLGESPLPLKVGVRIAQLCLIPVPISTTGIGYFKSNGKYIGPVAAGIPRIRDDPDWEVLGIVSPE